MFRLSLSALALVLLTLAVMAYGVIMEGSYIANIGHFEAPYGITFKIGPVESVISILFAFVTAMVVWYASFGVEQWILPNRINLYLTLIHLLLASLLGIVYTDDLFNSFVFIEVSTLAGCGIISIKDEAANIKSSLKYLILSSLGSGLILMGIAYLYTITGHLNMEAIHETLLMKISGHEKAILVSLTMFTIGLGIKSAMFPLHVWLPDAYVSAPGPSSAMLSGIVGKAPALLLFKILFFVYGIEILKDTVVMDLLLFFGAAGMIAGSLMARVQKDVKRLVAYSSVSQMGYIFFGFGIGSTMGLTIALYHIVAHGLTKSCLFLAVSSMIEQSGHREIDKLRGIGHEMPITLAIFTIGAMSMVGIPVLPGFMSKWNLAVASVESGRFYLLLVILASSLLSASYYFPIVINAYFGNLNLEGKVYKSKGKPVRELLPIIFLISILIMTGFGANVLIRWISTGVPHI